MKAIQLEQYNDTLGDLSVIDMPMPIPQKSDALIKIECAGIIPADLLSLEGKYLSQPTLPFVAGIYAVGEVVETGSPENNAMIGMRVFFIPGSDRAGTWAQYALADTNACIPIGDMVTETAMSLGNSVTAVGLLSTAKKHGAQAAVMNASAGSLGRLMNSLALNQNFPLINIVRSEQQAEILRSIGALHIIDQTADDFENQLRIKAVELNATVAFDSIAGDIPQMLMEIMPMGSTIITLGNLSGVPVQINPVQTMMGRQQRFEVFVVSHWMGQLAPDTLMENIGEAAQLSVMLGENNTIRHRLSLEETVATIHEIGTNTSAGMAVIYPNNG